MAVSLWYGERYDALGFLVSAVVTTAAGHLMRAADRCPRFAPAVDALTVVAGSWLMVAVAGALPLPAGSGCRRSTRCSSRCPA